MNDWNGIAWKLHIFLQSRGIKSQLELTVTELARLVFDPEEKRKLLDVQSRLSRTLQELKIKMI